VPEGVPLAVVPLGDRDRGYLVPLAPHFSLSVRLFANMLAGHITLKVFAGFVASLSAFGLLGWGGALLPLVMTVAITALEFLVSFLQAYVFAVLTCMYLNDALHPSHYAAHGWQEGLIPLGDNMSLFAFPALRSFQRSSIMEAEAAKFIGAGIACLGMGVPHYRPRQHFRQLSVGRSAQPDGS
jgi:hypothetical protein